MTIETYSDLKGKIVEWFAGRTDIAVAADDIIDLAEGFLNLNLRCREMETVTDLTPSSNVCTLPSDYLEYKRVVELSSIRRPLAYVTEEGADELFPTRTSGLSTHFMIVGDGLTALPLSSNDIELTYYQRLPALSESQTTNWLLTKLPNLYLHACLMYVAEYVRNDAQQAKEALMTQRLIDHLLALDQRSKFSGATVTLPGNVW